MTPNEKALHSLNVRVAWAQSDLVPFLVYYQNPVDHPGKHVLRLWYGAPQPTATTIIVVCDAHEEVLAFVRDLNIKFHFKQREPNDLRSVVGTWV